MTRPELVAKARAADGGWILAPAGLGLLLIRPLFASGPVGWWLLAACYLAVGIASSTAVRAVDGGSARRPRDPAAIVLAGFVPIGAFAVMAVQPTIPTRLGLAGLALMALASIAEEAFFRGFLYALLIRRGSLLAIAASAGAFALVHALAYPSAAVWVDFAAGLMFGWQRWITGSWLVPAGTHLLANLMVVMS